MRPPYADDDEVHPEAAQDEVPEPGVKAQEGHKVDVRDAEREQVAEVGAGTCQVDIERSEGVRDQQRRDELGRELSGRG